ncbi:Gfo/Idh/MocA family protein [Sphingomonas sp.]|uniref:Gfo/Idh/MocA family protein n=1 Tax=Sphingomonas sp. TaxID=28214 RepID=UPI003AFFB291
MADPIKLALVGVGKIARDQHIPAIRGEGRFALAATVDPKGGLPNVASYTSLDALLASGDRVDAVSLATPAAGRRDLVAKALDAGLHVMIEKPPAATLSEVDDMAALADHAKRVLFTSWHSRGAPFVDAAREWLASRTVQGLRITWKEDVRHWHPGQEWLFGPGGFGCFDPGINALSIATRILPVPLFIEAATLFVPQGRDQPIAATLTARAGGAAGRIEFDIRQTGPQTWEIEVDTDAGLLALREGGAVIERPGAQPERGDSREYPSLYAHFAELIGAGVSDVDARPLRLVADAFLVAGRTAVEPFSF